MTCRTRLDRPAPAGWPCPTAELKRSIELGSTDSETYGIHGGLLKQKLITAADQLPDPVINAQLRRMREQYLKGWEADPTYYSGVNVVSCDDVAHCSNPYQGYC
jgi:hypothetical protein